MGDRREYTFERKIDPGFEASDFEMDRRGASGARRFRLSTGADDDFFSRKNTTRRDRFNREFIGKFNEATGHNLDPENRHVKEELRNMHRRLERGDDQIKFKVGRRME